CDPSLGCTHYAISTACDDDDACTVDDVCVGGLCNGSAIDCSGLDNACEVGLCDSDAGSCVVQPTIDCSFLDDLGVAGVCNPASGACEAQSCASLELLPHSELPIAGGSLVVDLVIDVGESSLGAHSFDLSWTPSELELSGVTHGDSSEFASDPICNIDTAGGHASCAAYQIGSMTGPTGRVHVATFNLTAVSDADSTTLTVEADELASPGLYSLLPCDNPRTLELRGAAGDVNGDGHVNIVDALFAAQYTVNMRGCASFPRYHMCDINPSTPDGRCGIADALWMAQCGVGLIPCGFDCGVLSCDAPQGAAMRIDAASDQVPSRARLHAQEPPTLPAPGELFTSEIFIDTDAALGAYDLSFDCDPAVLEVAAPVRGGGAEEFSTPPIQKVSGCHGELSGFQVTNMAGPSGSISVAEVDLRVLDHNASAGSNPIRVRPKVLVDTTGQPIETYVDPCLDDTSKTGTIRSAMVRAVSTKGTPGGALSVRALLPLTELSKLSSAGGLKFSLLDAAELSLYSAQVPASTFAKAGGKRNRYRFRNADRTATNGLLEFSLRLAPKKGIARLKARAAVAKIDAVMGEPTLTLQLLLGNDAAGNCLRGPDLQCKGKARRLRCR
ncbi:MAG: hypothetical protein ACE5D3_00505, partial [Candidatus Binatia bacterium]